MERRYDKGDKKEGQMVPDEVSKLGYFLMLLCIELCALNYKFFLFNYGGM